jgi:imidazolonepropionase-like amidohydrolase
LLSLLLATAGATGLSAQDLVLTNARIVDPAGGTVVEGDLWIADGVVAGVGAAPADAAGERIDLGGRWVIPALHDLHTHSSGNRAPGRVVENGGTRATAVRVLRAGVTSFLDLFGAEDDIFRVRAAQWHGDAPGAEIFAAGPCFTATRGHCSEYGLRTRIIDTPDEARRELRELARRQPDVVKLVYDHRPGMRPSVDRPTMEAFLSTAGDLGLKSVVHVGTWQDVRDVVLAGATAVTHVPLRDTVPADLAALMAERGVYHIPALAAEYDLPDLLEHPELVDSPLFQAMAGDALRAAYRSGAAGLSDGLRAWAERQRANRETVLASVRRLYQAGVTLLTGTDGGETGVVQGYSVHREMLHLVAAGLSPRDALRAATVSAGEFLGRPYGVRPGSQADLVVLDASPLDDIANTQRIDLVVMRGRVVTRVDAPPAGTVTAADDGGLTRD